jgi:hypothetical protein
MYEMPNYLARLMSPQQYQSYAPTTQSNAFASQGPMAGRANYQRFSSNMSPEDEEALFQEMRAYQMRRNNPGSPTQFIYGNVPRGPGYATDRGRDPTPYNYDLFSQALPGRDNTPTSMTAPAGDGMLGGVGRLARYQAFLNPRPSMSQRS